MNTEHLQKISKEERKKFQLSLKKLILNRKYIFLQDGDERPKTRFKGMPLKPQFPPGPSLLWIFDPGTGMWNFFSLDKNFKSQIKDLISRRTSIEDIDLKVSEMLFHSRILVLASYEKSRINQWDSFKAKARNVRKESWAVVRDVLSPYQVAMMSVYSESLRRNGYFYLDDGQVQKKRRQFCANDPLCEYYNRQGGNLVRRVTGEPVFPSWSLLSTYFPRAELLRHLDRDQCAWNVSLSINTDKKGGVINRWPLLLQNKNEKPAEILLRSGDAAIYRGNEVFHWRPRLKKRNEQVALLFYVPVDFMGPLEIDYNIF